MEKFKYIIIGAGPSGLSFAHRLIELGEQSFVLLEREQEVGGLCRSVEVDGAPLDTGGGHFLDVKRREVLDFVFRFMPESEWTRHRRKSVIQIFGQEVDYPLESNVWQLPVEKQVDYITAAARAGSALDVKMPEEFQEWIQWKLGEAIARDYMIPYNKKIWSVDLNTLGTYWLYKLPNVSFREILQSCLERKPYGSIPAHGEFYYPKKFGYGEVWRRMGVELGDKLRTGVALRQVDTESRVVNETLQAETIINTAPWTAWAHIAELPTYVRAAIDRLVHIPIDVEYFSRKIDSSAHWIYYPDPEVRYHRALLRANFLPGSRGYWTESNGTRTASKVLGEGVFRNEYAYPVNTRGKPEAVKIISEWAFRNGIVPLGRWGTWEHMNSDVAVELGRKAAHGCFLRNL